MNFQINERLFSSIINRLTDFIIITDLEGCIQNVNKSFLELLNCKNEDLVNKPVNEIFKEKQKNIFDTMGFGDTRTVCLAFSNQRIPLKISSSIIYDEQLPAGILMVAKDMSETTKLTSNIKELKQTMRKKEEENTTKLSFLSDALACVGESVFICDCCQRIIYYNKTAMDNFSYSLEDIIGKSPELLYEADDMSGFKGDWTGEVLAVKKNGETFPALLTTSFIKNKVGKEIGVVGVFRDISEIKNLFKQLEDIGRELESRVLQRTEELENSKAQLLQSSKLASIGTLAAGIAHELNNPLTIIMGYCHLLLKDVIDPEVKIRMEKIQDQCIRAKKIIHNLSIFARSHKTEKRQCNLIDLLEKVLELRNYDLSINNITVVKEFDVTISDLFIDEHQIQQVFFNLINNSVDAILSVKNSGIIKIRTMRNGKSVKVAVLDDGCGIETDHIKKIFDPFYTTKEVGKGTGLGLSISYGIIKAHQGNISVESSEGRGSTFIVELPIN